MDIMTQKSVVPPQIDPLAATAPKKSDTMPVNQLPPDNAAPMDQQQLEDTLASLQDATQALQRDLSFSLDDSSGQVIVKVTDSASGKIVRQMPTEEALRMLESLDELRGLLFKTQA